MLTQKNLKRYSKEGSMDKMYGILCDLWLCGEDALYLIKVMQR